MIGFDSSAIIDFFRGDKSLKEVLEKIDEPFALNIVSYSEIMFGIDSSKVNGQTEIEFYDRMFDSCLVFNLDRKACRKASEILWQLKKIGKVIELFDCSI